MKPIKTKTEHSEQCAVVDYARRVAGQIPELDLLFAIPNGAMTPNYALAQKLKNEGLRPGVPDLFLPCARNGKNGLFLEMKSPGGVASQAQKEFIRKVLEQGYEAVVCYSADEAIGALESYLDITEG